MNKSFTSFAFALLVVFSFLEGSDIPQLDPVVAPANAPVELKSIINQYTRYQKIYGDTLSSISESVVSLQNESLRTQKAAISSLVLAIACMDDLASGLSQFNTSDVHLRKAVAAFKDAIKISRHEFDLYFDFFIHPANASAGKEKMAALQALKRKGDIARSRFVSALMPAINRTL